MFEKKMNTLNTIDVRMIDTVVGGHGALRTMERIYIG